jgi:hypothetical protein
MKFTLLMLIALFFCGCAAKKLAVENADTLISYQVNKRLPLYSAQEEELLKDIDKFLNETKPKTQEILPVIDKLNLSDPSKLDAEYLKVETFYKTLSKDFSDLMAKYLAKLDKKQQKELFETLDDENREIIKSEKKDRIDNIEGRFETFLGSINSAQKQLVREYADYFHSRSKMRLDKRIELHQSLKSIYRQDVSEDSRNTQMKEAMAKYQSEKMARNKNLEILKKIIPTLSNKQREHFRQEAQEVKDVLSYFNSVDY